MLDIELKWLIVLIINFLVLVSVLNSILFRPLLAIFKERETAVKGSLDSAKEMIEKKDEGLERMNRELSDARRNGKDAFERLREEGLNGQKARNSLSHGAYPAVQPDFGTIGVSRGSAKRAPGSW